MNEILEKFELELYRLSVYLVYLNRYYNVKYLIDVNKWSPLYNLIEFKDFTDSHVEYYTSRFNSEVDIIYGSNKW